MGVWHYVRHTANAQLINNLIVSGVARDKSRLEKWVEVCSSSTILKDTLSVNI